MNTTIDLTLGREVELFSSGAQYVQIITPAIFTLARAYPNIGECSDVTAKPWRPIEADQLAGRVIVETLAYKETLEELRTDPRFTVIFPPERIVTDLNPVEVMRVIQSGKVSPGDIFICYREIQFSIHQVDDAKVTFELDSDQETQVYTFPIVRKVQKCAR